MMIFVALLLGFLIICAVSACLNKSLLASIVIYMAYSSVICMIWILLESPDLAITEAAVGAGVNSVLFFVTLKKINSISDKGDREEPADE